MHFVKLLEKFSAFRYGELFNALPLQLIVNGRRSVLVKSLKRLSLVDQIWFHVAPDRKIEY